MIRDVIRKTLSRTVAGKDTTVFCLITLENWKALSWFLPSKINEVKRNWQYNEQGFCGSLKVLEFFPDFQGLESPWKQTWSIESPRICVWRSLKVLELDFLKRRALLLVEGFWGPEICQECVVGQEPHPLGAFGALILAPSLIYPSYGPWKSLKSPWIWFW